MAAGSVAIGCEHEPSVTEVAGPDHRQALLVQCEGDSSGCYTRASAECPEGYELLSSDSHTESSISLLPPIGKGPQLLFHSETVRPELLIRCNETPQGPGLEPDGALGYAFGDVAPRVKAECEEQGYEWTESQSGALCDGIPATLGLKGRLVFEFCGGGLCKLAVVGRIDARMDVAWRATLDRLEGRLEERYGSPWHTATHLPIECRNDKLLGCLGAMRSSVEYEWHWPSGTTLWLSLTGDGGRPAIEVRYDVSDRRAYGPNAVL